MTETDQNPVRSNLKGPKWPLSKKRSFFEIFSLIFTNVLFFHNLSNFLVYTGCGSEIRHYKFNFPTLYIPKKLLQVFLEWNIDVAFSKKKTRPNKSSKSVKNWVFSREVIFGHFLSLPVGFLCTKKLSQVYLEWNIDVAFSKYQKSTTKQKFKISKNYVASDLASVEACREVGGCISMSHFFVKISYLNIFSLIFWNFYQKSCNFRPKAKRWGKLSDLRFSLCRGL